MSIIKWFEGIGIVLFLKNLVQKHPAEEYARDMANELKKMIDNEVGEKTGEVIRDTVLPFIDKFYISLRKTLNQ